MTRARARSAGRLLLAFSGLTLAVALAVPSSLAATPDAKAQRPPPPCAVGERSTVGGVDVCSHGGDPAPPEPTGVAVGRAAPLPKAPCPGNGKGGPRVVVAYGYPSDTPNRSAAMLPVIRQAIKLADLNLDAASSGTPGQHYRFLCKDDVKVTIQALPLLPIGSDGTFTWTDFLGSLRERVANGLGERDLVVPRYVYSVFVDNIGCCYGPAGQATISHDDRADPSVNWNNRTAGYKYALIKLGYSPASEARIWQHEVGHNLGAVQNSAPHTSGAGHCYEEYDIMCYPDGGPWFQSGHGMVANCTAGMPNGLDIFDCNGDDYYALVPEDGSYLTDHWNLADSRWLSLQR